MASRPSDGIRRETKTRGRSGTAATRGRDHAFATALAAIGTTERELADEIRIGIDVRPLPKGGAF
jgi:hypothetical protein